MSKYRDHVAAVIQARGLTGTAQRAVESLVGLKLPSLCAVCKELGISYTFRGKRGEQKFFRRITMVNHIADWGVASPEGDWQKLYDVTYDARKGRLRLEGVTAPAAVPKVPSGLSDKDVRAIVRETVAGKFEGAQEEIIEALRPWLGKLLDTHRKIEIVTKDEKGKVRKRKKLKYTLPPEFDTMLELARARKHIFLVGPTGSGKSFLAERLAEALDLHFASISCSAGMSESQLSGWLLPSKGGEFVYRESPFVRAYTQGGVFLVDEIDNADPNVMTFLNAALANGHMYVPQRFEEQGRLTRHRDFVCVCAANTWGTGADELYVGRNQLDEATLNRFTVGRIFLDYNDAVEDSLGSLEVLAWARAVRAAIREHGLRRVMSTRNIRDFSDMQEEADWKIEQWERAYFADWSEDEAENVREAGREAYRKVA